jgi:predicted alpha/beta hydrolase family esterase
MKKVYLIHGFEGSPNGGWRPYLMRELAHNDISSFSLSMPSPEKPILDEWLSEIKRYIDRDINDEIYLVGHSLGGTAILRYLEKFDSQNIKGIVSVSAPCICKKENSRISEFLEDNFDWNLIKNKVSKVAVIHGDDDPLVPVVEAEKISNELDGKLIIIKNGKHLNGSAGFIELPELLEVILRMIK